MKKNLHIVFKTHLDVGFTALGRDVETSYIERFVPAAMDLADMMKKSDDGSRFVWTIGSWLAHRCLETYRGAKLRRFEKAIEDGDIVWHALPFTMHSELLTESLFEYGLSFSWELDRRFGKTTKSAKLTDVPGHTRGIVPLMADAGIEFLHIGSNPGSTPPDVPELFIWEDSASGSRITVMYQKGGYGDIYASPQYKTGLLMAFTSDNLGPPTLDETLSAHRLAKETCRGWNVMASTLDAFADELLAAGPKLPLVTMEMGDTWIHGVGSAPGKVRRFRELCRRRDEWLAEGVSPTHVKKFNSFSENLLLIGEHTWGLDVKTHLADTHNFTAADLSRARKLKNFKLMEESWKEQESYIDNAVAALKGTPYQKKAEAALKSCEPVFPAFTKEQSVKGKGIVLENDLLRISFGSSHGGATELLVKDENENYAGRHRQLGLPLYEAFGMKDVQRFLKQYGYNNPEDWFQHDFGKPGLEAALNRGGSWKFLVKKTFRRDVDCSREITMLLAPSHEAAKIGCPKEMFITWRLRDGEKRVEIDLAWRKKKATRIPEALWLGFSPKHALSGDWEMEKMGQWVSPLRVMHDGNRKLHAVGAGVMLVNDFKTFTIESKDAPLVAPGEPSLYNFDNHQPPVHKGMFFNLYNNVWGTNFPQWTSEDAIFRFELSFGTK